MKKLLCLTLALIMVTCLCACSQETPNNTDSSSIPSGDNASQPTQNSTVNNTETGTKQPASIESIQDITFTIKGTNFHLGMKLSEFINSGVFTDITSRDQTLEEIESGGATAILDVARECKITLYLWNLSRNEIDIKDATVVGLSYDLEYGSKDVGTMVEDVSFDGVKLNASIENIISVFGNPNDHDKTSTSETSRRGGWRGFDIEDEFRLYIDVTQPTGESPSAFSLQFKPFTDNIK